MKSNCRKVQCVETGEIFNSCRESDRKFELPFGETWQMAAHYGEETYRNQRYGLHFKFIYGDPVPEPPAFDPEVIAYIYAPVKDVCKKVQCVETGQIFNSCVEADKAFGYVRGSVGKMLGGHLKFREYTFKEVVEPSICLEDYKPTAKSKEIFKEIPEYPTYSISNFGRVRHDSTGHIKSIVKSTKSIVGVTYAVVLQLNRRPRFCSLRSLYRSAWLGEPIRMKTTAAGSTGRSKTVVCKTDERLFGSYTACVEFYGFDYQQFREALHDAESNEFTFKGKVFSVS